MNWGDGLLALLGICAFSLLWARKWELNAALLPLPVLGASVVWLWLFGMADQLALGGWLWFAGAAAALCLLLVGGHKGQSLPARLKAGGLDALQRAAVPGFVFFVGAALFFWILFALTQPMFIRWDEFTFWGTACKMTKEANQLHAVAPGNLSARAYLPGMMLVSYLFQFLGAGFAEWKTLAAYDILAAAVFAAFAAQEKKRWPFAVLTLAGTVLLPYLFTPAGDETVSTIYLTAMGDLSLGLVFGGVLCLYFRLPRSPKNLTLVGLSLLLLTLIKDMGMAYALIAAALIALDILIYPRLCLPSLGRAAAAGIGLGVPVAAAYLGWSRYVLAAADIEKNVVGNSEKSYGYGYMFTDGLKQFLGRGSEENAEKFNTVLGLMKNALVHTPLSLAGSALAVLAALAAVLGLCLVMAPAGQRRRPALFGLAGLGAFGAFVLFHLLLYVYSFSDREALILKDYERYIGTFLMGWMMASLGLLGLLAPEGRWPRLGQGAGILCSGAMALVFCLKGVPSAGFWNYPHENYAVRREVAYRASLVNPELSWDDEVLLISQGDDATRWYYYSYELNAQLANGFGGFGYSGEDDWAWETTFMTLVSPYQDEYNKEFYAYQSEYQYTAECSRDDLVAFLRDTGYGYILLDQSDKYVYYEFGPLFTEKVPIDRADAAYLYKVVDDGVEMRFEPVGEVRYVS